ncbi:MAG TPA: amino acid permease [Rickettsiales bacterium]|nr:amino acid permease [Rickettsiales bacterium]
MRNLFIKKSILHIQEDAESCTLHRSLSVFNLISLGIGCIIGAGIFSLTGEQTAVYAGPAIMISFVLAAVACAFAALCYAELASTLPVSGSAYTYAYATLGELAAWIMGWLLILEYGVAAATVAVSWAGYFVSLMKDFGVVIPEIFMTPTILYDPNIGGWHAVGFHGAFNLPAAASVAVLTVLLVIGIKESATVNNIVVMLKITVLVLLVVVGLPHINTALWHPFIPPAMVIHDPQTGSSVTHYGWPGILHAAAVISFAFVGFEAVSTAAQEAKNPQRDMPIGILASLAICTVLYILVGAVLTGLVHYSDLNVPDPLALAVDTLGVGWLKWVVKVGAVIGMFSVTLVLLYGQTRIFFSMGRDRLLPAFFSTTHPRFKTPHWNTIIVGTVTALIAGLTPIDILGDLVSLGTLLAFAIVCFSVIYLRYKRPDMKRVFSVPFFPYTPIIGIGTCIWLMAGIINMMILLFIFYIPIGLLIYFLYSRHRSVVRIMARDAAA